MYGRGRAGCPARHLSRNFHPANSTGVQCPACVHPGRVASPGRRLPSFARSCRVIKIDFDKAEVTVDDESGTVTYELDTPEAFAAVSRAWLRVGWDTKHVYSFTWLGRPIIQLPEDMFRVQEAIYAVKPTLIIETGVAHGGSLIFYASLLKAMGGGRVIGIDVEIRPPNRRDIETHELSPMITLVEGSSTAPNVVEHVRSLRRAEDRTFVMLDSNHTKAHVLAELQAYAGLVTPGSYIVAADGIMADLEGAPRSGPDGP